MSVIHDGIDTRFWRPDPNWVGPGAPRRVGSWTIPAGTRLVTYVSRGFESMRGFDVFMRVAQRLCDQRSDVVFAVVGEDRVCYGGDARFTGGKTFKQWVLAQGRYDLSRIRFLGRLSPAELVVLLGAADLHMYLTTPFVLSWSLLNAMACGASVLVSNTAPVREVVENGKTGLCVEFGDVDRWCAEVNAVLDDPAAFRRLGAAVQQQVQERYDTEVCLPKLLAHFRTVVR